jgi:glycosyltransferase involved in cell wall biosynthesis
MNLQSPTSNVQFSGCLALQQRVIPSYRAPFFDQLAAACEGGLSVFVGEPLAVEGISTAAHLEQADLQMAENLHFSDPSTRYYLCWQRGIVEWLEAWDPDALILEGNPRYLSNRLALRWMKQRGRPVLGWGLGAPALNGAFSGLRRWKRKNYLAQFDGIIAYSQRGAREYQDLGLVSEKVFVATNSVMPRPDHETPQRPATFAGRPQVLFVGRLQTRKRLDILLHACASLPADIQPNLVIVGDGPARVEFQLLSEQVYPRVEFVGGKYGDETRPYFQQADLFALPGTGGLAVQQAMTYCLPVIVAKGDGTQDDLVRPENGWQVTPGDQDAFTDALRNALSNVERLRGMGRESFRIVQQEANLERMVAVFVDALDRVGIE